MKIGLVDSGSGVIPFLKEIIKENIKNEYYIYIDKNNFPYGNKNDNELKNILKNIFVLFEKQKIDLLLIVCNTLSLVYLTSSLKTSFKIKTILEYNLLSSSYALLATLYVKNNLKDRKVICGKNLASLIEENKEEKINNLIKELNLKENVILSCTHYPLVINAFKKIYPSLIFIDNTNKFILELQNSLFSSFYVNKEGKKLILSSLPNLRIKEW